MDAPAAISGFRKSFETLGWELRVRLWGSRMSGSLNLVEVRFSGMCSDPMHSKFFIP